MSVDNRIKFLVDEIIEPLMKRIQLVETEIAYIREENRVIKERVSPVDNKTARNTSK